MNSGSRCFGLVQIRSDGRHVMGEFHTISHWILWKLAQSELGVESKGAVHAMFQDRTEEELIRLLEIWNKLCPIIDVEMVSQSENIYKDVFTVTFSGYDYDLTCPKTLDVFFQDLCIQFPAPSNDYPP